MDNANSAAVFGFIVYGEIEKVADVTIYSFAARKPHNVFRISDDQPALIVDPEHRSLIRTLLFRSPARYCMSIRLKKTCKVQQNKKNCNSIII